MRTSWIAGLSLALALACTDGTAPEPAGDIGGLSTAAHSVSRITVLTQNMYPGTNLDLVVAALASPNPNDDAPALQFALQTLSETDYPARAALLADEIARKRPQAVALQEVSTFNIAAAIAGTDIQLDFLPILSAELAARGLHYVEAGAGTNYSLDPIPGVSYSQGDALLIDADQVTINSASHHVFTTNIGEVAPGVTLRQGWSVADADVSGKRVLFVSTHPESNLGDISLSLLRAAQVTELVSTLPSDVPAVIMGDLNDEPGSPMYQVLTGAGLMDVWRALRPGVTGNTCCHDDNLGDKIARFDEHIDFVFARGFGRGAPGLQGQISLFGDQPSERTEGPLHPIWASDHAGILASLLTPPGR
ncbi:MAG TPA: endonuclease/exonuclease/phosphatase family protein [Gemmatimonadales bacterium]|jgi:endonuclease/exonuclease/phosphatase family metal-dependent hydrolase